MQQSKLSGKGGPLGHPRGEERRDQLPCTIHINNVSSGGSNYQFDICCNVTDVDSTPYGLTNGQIYSLDNEELILSDSSGNVHFGRAYFTYNRWENLSTGAFQYQTNDGNGIHANNPPWGGWENGQDPLHSSTGGNFWVECDESACS